MRIISTPKARERSIVPRFQAPPSCRCLPILAIDAKFYAAHGLVDRRHPNAASLGPPGDGEGFINRGIPLASPSAISVSA